MVKSNSAPVVVKPAPGPPRPDPAPTAAAPPTETEVGAGLALLFGAGQAIEVRAPQFHDGRRTVNVVSRFGPGQTAAAAREALGLSGGAPAVYVVMNGVDPALPLGRRVTKGAAAEDVPRRRWLLVDCDPVRPGTVNATDAEKAAALALAETVRAGLAADGWPEPIRADSGNGYHLLYRVDLPPDDASTELVKRGLIALAERFDAEAAKVDRKVFDPPRLVKCYGTRVCKGEDAPDRPARFARLLAAPDAAEPAVVPRALLEALANATEAEAPAPARPTTAAEVDRKRGRDRASSPSSPRTGTATNDATTTPDAIEARAVAYLAKCEPAISGSGGHDQTFKVAVAVGPGFDLPPDTAFRLLWTLYNPRCEPPWSEPELRHKVDDAYEKEPRRGWKLLEAKRPRRDGRAAANGNGNGRASGPPPPDGRQDTPPDIVIGTDEYRVADQAVAALASDPDVYQRGNALVRVQRDCRPAGAVTRPPGSPTIASLPMPTLRETLTRRATWLKVRAGRDGPEHVAAHPPDWCVAGVAARGAWPSVRYLEGIVETPVLRPDGSILDRPGYDHATGLLHEPAAAFPAVPVAPTHADAKTAADVLLDIVCDFPFAGPSHRAAWLAALLTPFARHAIDGCCPCFVFDGTTPGSGKSLLADVIATVATGRTMPRKAYPSDDDEMRKTITAVALAGDPLVLLDNVATAFGTASLDAALTGRTWRDRVLGRSEMTAELPLYTTWYASGNNVQIRGDALRRVLPCRLEPTQERPEERQGFRHPHLLAKVRAERAAVVKAALTILRAFHLAGRPTDGLKPFGGFEAWSALVRGAVAWSTGVDPLDAREDLRAADSDSLTLNALVHAWSELPGATGDGVTVADALAELRRTPDGYSALRAILGEWTRGPDLPSAAVIGRKLAKFEGRVCRNLRLCSRYGRTNTKTWRVASVDATNPGMQGMQGHAGAFSPRRAENASYNCQTHDATRHAVEKFSPDAGKMPLHAPASPARHLSDDELLDLTDADP